ncbi:hypothetical protein pdam_00015817 [Pocillopora damicornis]|uniref:Uncharacterized protein n=1 Tax=Pocillopora damicornis TaxID=46731 RepID=A0A3M6T611_POCDA|nr:hypothetical protein pdam_00015817 [Pocillopora damicornis]
MQPKKAYRGQPSGWRIISNPKSWYPVPEYAMIVSALQRVRWQKLEVSRCTSIREKFSWVNRSASNSLTSRSSKTNRRRGK